MRSSLQARVHCLLGCPLPGTTARQLAVHLQANTRCLREYVEDNQLALTDSLHNTLVIPETLYTAPLSGGWFEVVAITPAGILHTVALYENETQGQRRIETLKRQAQTALDAEPQVV